jgi:hypothetical protein
VTTIARKTTTTGVTIKSADQGVALIRFSTPDGVTPDKEGDVTGPNAFTEGAQCVVSPFGHRSITDGAIPAGRATIHRNGTADLEFFLDTEVGRKHSSRSSGSDRSLSTRTDTGSWRKAS